MKLLSCIVCALLTGCSFLVKETGRYRHGSKVDMALQRKLPEELYLENRMGCERAIAFMDSIVIPGKLSSDSLILNKVTAHPFIPYENNKKFLLPPGVMDCYPRRVSCFRFYFAPKCFVNLDAQKIYNIFVKPEYHKMLNKFDKDSGANGYFISFAAFGFGFQIKGGKVARYSESQCQVTRCYFIE